jgi:hypothetical protein
MLAPSASEAAGAPAATWALPEGSPSNGQELGYGSAPAGKGRRARFPKRHSLNIVPIVLCLLVPWILFVVCLGSLCFSVHYYQPQYTRLILAFALILVLVCICVTCRSALKALCSPPKDLRALEEEESGDGQGSTDSMWLVALALLMTVAFITAVILGNSLYNKYTLPYYDIDSFNSYTNILPGAMRGQQLMDAGTITFAEGSHLDLSKASSFKDGTTYCVAPIVHGDQQPATYDFWVVGTGCCSGNFTCQNYNEPKANGGIRVMSANSFWRLAVQQAEVKLGIKANYPIFFNWEENPEDVVNDWQYQVWKSFLIDTWAYFLFQCFVVLCLALVFAKRL